MLTTACIPNGSDDDPIKAVPGVPTGTVAIPAERLTPFCQAMIDLSERLETDPPSDVDAYIIEAYSDIADQVPPEIANEFDAVLARLEGLPVPTIEPDAAGPSTTDQTATTAGTDSTLVREGDEFFEEGYVPGDDPAERLNAYVNFACRDIQNNPGPPATQPLSEIAPPATDS